MGRSEEELRPVPGEEDVYTTMRAEFMSRETGRDDTVAHNIRKNPMKEFAEAQLGNTVNNEVRWGGEGGWCEERKTKQGSSPFAVASRS